MTVYISLGTNLGHKEENLRKACCGITEKIGRIRCLSSFYETQPWGFESENRFLNAVAAVDTALSPLEALAACQEIERGMGRAAKSVNGAYHDRIIDLDLLFWGNRVIQTPLLTVPHPRAAERLFVLEPMVEIDPFWVHPVLKVTMLELYRRLAGH